MPDLGASAMTTPSLSAAGIIGGHNHSDERPYRKEKRGGGRGKSAAVPFLLNTAAISLFLAACILAITVTP